MDNLLIYLARSFICLGILYLAWWAFMRKDTFFTINRYYLFASILFSLILPAFNFSAITSFGSISTRILLDAITVKPEELHTAFLSNLSAFQVITVVYLTGVAIFSIRFLIQLVQIYRLITKYGISRREGIKIVFTDSNYAPFSFFGLIFLNSKFNEEDIEKIVIHEKVHIDQRHSVDLILLELLTIIQWFNPFTWLYRKSLKSIHEFLADEGVLLKGFDKFGYQQLLLSMSLGIQVNDLTNNIHKSIIKRRFTMMNREKSNISSSLKYAVLLPFALTALILFGINDLPSKTPVLIISDSVYVNPDVMPLFPGGEKALQKFLISNVKYPEICRENKIQGKVVVDFTVTKSGKVENIKVSLSAHPEMDKEGMRVIGLMPDWSPGQIKGNVVDVKMSMPFNFKLQ